MCPAPAARWQVLQNARQFGVVMQQGRVLARSPHFVLHAVRWPHSREMAAAAAEPPQAGPSRSAALFPATSTAPAYYGAIVPKRWARRAVTRNLIKRQIRHVVGEHAPAPQDGLALVLRLRAAFDPQRFVSASSLPLRRAVRAELIQLLQQASRQNWQALPRLPAPPGRASLSPASSTASAIARSTCSAQHAPHSQPAP
ncbi:MAG: ribonuclease P protein component [Brachymonas sp.]|nr:ribonuclease P protein component [Brachymonas sp.]